MKPTEEHLTPEAVAALEQQARKMLVEVHALAGLIGSGCLEPEIFMPMITGQLQAIHIGDGEIRVLVFDGDEVRRGPRGPMTAVDLANELKQKEAFREFGWKPRSHTQTPGEPTGRRFERWQ